MNTEYFSFCPRLQQILETQTVRGSNGKTLPVRGASTMNNLRVLRETILEHRFKNTIEIGLAYGVSALTILSTLRRISPDGFSHTAIDPFEHKEYQGCGLRVIQDEGLGGNFRFHEDYSAIVLPLLMKEEEQFDLAYVDGSHLFEEVFIDLYYLSHLVRVGGVIFFDDCTDLHVGKVIRFILRNYRSILEPYDLGAHEDPQKPIGKKIGNLLGIRQLRSFRKVADPPRSWNAPFHDF